MGSRGYVFSSLCFWHRCRILLPELCCQNPIIAGVRARLPFVLPSGRLSLGVCCWPSGLWDPIRCLVPLSIPEPPQIKCVLMHHLVLAEHRDWNPKYFSQSLVQSFLTRLPYEIESIQIQAVWFGPPSNFNLIPCRLAMSLLLYMVSVLSTLLPDHIRLTPVPVEKLSLLKREGSQLHTPPWTSANPNSLENDAEARPSGSPHTVVGPFRARQPRRALVAGIPGCLDYPPAHSNCASLDTA